MRRFAIAVTLSLVTVSCSVTKHIPATYPELGQEFKNHKSILESVTYPTSIPGPSERRMYVYLPDDYYNTDRRYPVLYLLHGARGDEASWITQGNILTAIDSLRQAASVEQMLVVFPNMNSYDSEADYAKSRHKGALESFFEVDGAVEYSFVRDVVTAIDSMFRTIPRKNARAIAGLSLGGMQTIYISASAPDVFGYVGVLSAPLHSALRKGPYSSFYDYAEAKVVNQFVCPPLRYDIYVGRKDVYKTTMENYSRWMSGRGYDCNLYLDEGGHQWPQWLSFASGFMTGLFK